MPNEKISQLSSGSPANLTDIIPIDRSGTSKSLQFQDVLSGASNVPVAPAPCWFCPPGPINGFKQFWDYTYIGTPAIVMANGAGTVDATMFFLNARITLTKFAHNMFSSSGTIHCRFALYSGDKQTLLWDSGQLTMPPAGSAQGTVSISNITLEPGVYWFAWSTDDSGGGNSTCRVHMLGSPLTGVTSAPANFFLTTGPTSPVIGHCTNSVGVACQAAFTAPLSAVTTASVLVPVATFGA